MKKKFLAVIAAVMVVVLFLGAAKATDPSTDPVPPELTQFEWMKDSIQQVYSKSNTKLKEGIVDEIELFYNEIFVEDFEILDAYLRVTGNDIYIVTLEKVGKEELNIEEYDVFVPIHSSTVTEEDIAKKIVSGEKIPNISDFSFTVSEHDIRMYPAE